MQDIGIDLGTATVIVYVKGKGIVLREPSVVAINNQTNEVLAVGYEARRMLGRTPGNIVATRPLRDGVISDYTITEKMLKYFINKVSGRSLFAPRMMICIPSKVTEVERKAVIDAASNAGARKVYLIEEPLAAAIGAGIDISKPNGNMIVDIGGGTTDIAVISAGDISYGVSLKVGGDDFTEAIARYVRRKYSIELGEQTAEDAKIEIASVIERKVDSSYEIKGKNMVNGLPVRLDLGANETVEALEEITSQIIDGIIQVIEKAEPELVADVAKEGILLSGGGSLIYGMDRLISDKTGIRAVIADEPENVVAAGAGMAGEYIMVQDEESKN